MNDGNKNKSNLKNNKNKLSQLIPEIKSNNPFSFFKIFFMSSLNVYSHSFIYFSKVYIIGGMVDHNRLKLATYNRAKEEGITMKKFPISSFVKLKSSTILAVNHGINKFFAYYFLKISFL